MQYLIECTLNGEFEFIPVFVEKAFLNGNKERIFLKK